MAEENLPKRPQTSEFLPQDVSYKIFKSGTDRIIQGFSVHYDSKLKASHVVDQRSHTNTFELWISDDIRRLMKTKGHSLVKRMTKQDLLGIINDPYETTSIDSKVNENEAREQRTVNHVSTELEELMGIPIAIKGTGKYISRHDSRWENLLAQFQFMRGLALKNTQLRDISINRLGFFPLRFLDVYAAMSYPISNRAQDIQQFLLMERIVDGRHVDQDPKKVTKMLLSYDDPESFDPNTGFFAADHPRLAAYSGIKDDFVGWLELKSQLKKDGIDVPDLWPRNILYTTDEQGNKNYVIIDQLPPRKA